MLGIDFKSLLAPLLYVVTVFGGLYVFSTLYKRYYANQIIEPYFPRHKERDIYVSLLQLSDPPAPEQLLKAALVRRAMTDVQRILRIREDKPVIQALLQKGSLGDDVLTSITAAEKELEAEIQEVATEANAYVEGWAQIIFQTATEMLHNEKMRSYVENLPLHRGEKELRYTVKNPPKTLPSSPAITSPTVASPTVPAVPPPTPATAKTSNGLAPPTPATPITPGSGIESAVSSDAEGPTSPSTPRTPKSAKKNKKRK
ncbi:hypothetical protein QCA50_002936 [Cerrena zonata]|uniref:Translocation protein sec66 n=1 Tax=Cerrena zonata TaxID=2478898 RepID=A0AAW0GJ54_9APHY